MTDPNFPDRPQHPDFFKLSAAVIENDDAGDNGASFQEILAQVGMTDPESLAYMAGQRVLRLTRHNFMSKETRDMFTMLYFDAFALGARFAQNNQEGS